MPRIVFITPPIIKPCEPGLSAAAAARWVRSCGVDAVAVDASIGWYSHTLASDNLRQCLARAEDQGYAASSLQAFRQGIGNQDRSKPPLRRTETYAQRKTYSSAISHLLNALRLASVPYPGFHLRVSEVEAVGRRIHNSKDLEELARIPGPFDAYFTNVLIPRLKQNGTSHVALSLTFLHQAIATFRLAFLLREHLPSVQCLLGGPLLACWKAVDAPLDTAPFRLFHRVYGASSEEDLNGLVEELGGQVNAGHSVLAPSLDDMPWDAYMTPQPIVPLALGRGCYWRRCTFCPDYLHPQYRVCTTEALSQYLVEVAERFPDGAMLHLTDSALSPHLLEHVAEVIRKHRLPLRWHGFVRMEARFAEPDFAQHLADGGCAMLQWGLETASPRLLELMGKGLTPEHAATVLQVCSEAGIKNHAYLLFGLPTETDEDRESTLAFIQAQAHTLHDLNTALLNLPRRSPMHEHPQRYGITQIQPFGLDMDLSLYDDFYCGDSHPRIEARQWLGRRFFKNESVKRILENLNAPFKANHACFLPQT